LRKSVIKIFDSQQKVKLQFISKQGQTEAEERWWRVRDTNRISISLVSVSRGSRRGCKLKWNYRADWSKEKEPGKGWRLLQVFTQWALWTLVDILGYKCKANVSASFHSLSLVCLAYPL